MINNKEYFDSLVKKYETPDFIKDDPIQFPHKFEKQEDIEISALISSTFAYGKREKIIGFLEKIHNIIENEPYNFVQNYDFKKDGAIFKGLSYRYNSENDVKLLFYILNKAYLEYTTLECLFLSSYSPNDENIKLPLIKFVQILKSYISFNDMVSSNISYCLPSPENGSACKRLNLFLKWMVRPQPVDFGLWKTVSASQLLIPLDTHVARLSRQFGLTERKSDDWKTAEEITAQLKKYDKNDPAKYDFALFGLGVSEKK